MRFLFVVTFLCLLAFDLHAEPGVIKDKIVFGQTAAIKGPAEKLGRGMQQGLLSAFKEINDAGGVKGRALELVTLDDGYEPDQSIHNVRQLIQQDQVFAVTGGVGTPTSSAIEPILSQARIPYIAPFTGAEFLRNPYKRYVVNIRGSYYQETEEMARILVDEKKLKRIAILYQDDSFGRAGLEGIKKALTKRHLSLIAETTYKRNTEAVKQAVLEIKDVDPDAVVMIGTYQPLAVFVKLCKRLNVKSQFITLSFVGSEPLAEALGPSGKNVIVTQVVPLPFDKTLKIANSYRQALSRLYPGADYGYVSFEGYIAGRFIAQVLGDMKGDVTREAFVDQILKDRVIKIDDLSLTFGEQDNQGLNTIYATVLTGTGAVEAYKPALQVSR